jgi:hypothetical protein
MQQLQTPQGCGTGCASAGNSSQFQQSPVLQAPMGVQNLPNGTIVFGWPQQSQQSHHPPPPHLRQAQQQQQSEQLQQPQQSPSLQQIFQHQMQQSLSQQALQMQQHQQNPSLQQMQPLLSSCSSNTNLQQLVQQCQQQLQQLQQLQQWQQQQQTSHSQIPGMPAFQRDGCHVQGCGEAIVAGVEPQHACQLPQEQQQQQAPQQPSQDVQSSSHTASKPSGADTIGSVDSTATGGGQSSSDLADALSAADAAEDIHGQVFFLSRSKAGSKQLQSQLMRGSPALVETILVEVEEKVTYLMCSAYGNYLCSAAFQACNQDRKKRILCKLFASTPEIACDKCGTHALQTLVGLLHSTEEQMLFVSSVQNRVVMMSTDANGNHVVQRLLQRFPLSVSNPVITAAVREFDKLANNQHGLCVLKICVTQAPGSQMTFALFSKAMFERILQLARSPFGNYLVQHALEEWDFDACVPFVHVLEGSLVQLSTQKYSSNVVETLLAKAPAQVQRRLVAGLGSRKAISELVASSYGHFVMNKALNVAAADKAEELKDNIRSVFQSSSKGRAAGKWEKLMQAHCTFFAKGQARDSQM